MGVVRRVNTQVLGRGLNLVDGSGNEWEMNQLLFADDTVVVADSEKAVPVSDNLGGCVREGSYE